MVSRFLDWLDESAAGVIRVAYLLAGMIAVASYFSDGNVPHGLTHTLDAVLPWTLSGALETHTYLTCRRVRGAYQDKQAATLGSDEHERAVGVMKVNLGILAGLLAFSMYNQLQYLAITWKPPHTPLTPPGPFAYLIRATITPAAFMAAAFLAPMGEGMAVQVRAEAHHLARLAFKAASAQWKRRLREMQRQGEDVTGALVQLVDDPTERRVIASIHAAMHGSNYQPTLTGSAESQPVASLEGAGLPDAPPIGKEASAAPQATERPLSASDVPPDKPPTGPGTPQRQRNASKHVKRGLGRRPAILRLTPDTAEKRIRAALAESPSLSIRQLAKRAKVSQATASKYRRLIQAEASRAQAAQ